MPIPNNLKALLIILILAVATFQFARPFALMYASRQDFNRRRNLWLGLTTVAFLSPSFWLFALVAAPLLVWVSRRDSNPVALYVFMLHVIPPIEIKIPVIGFNELFSLDMYRLLSVFVLLPLALRLRRDRRRPGDSQLRVMDFFILGYGALQTLLFVRPDIPNAAALHDSLTNVLRRAFLFAVDIYLVYYVASRFCRTREKIAEVMAAFCIAALVMAPIAIFETLRHWLLYKEMGTGWGGDVSAGYLVRGGVIRAMASAGDSLALGFIFALAFGFWLYLSRRMSSTLVHIGGIGALLLGLIAAYSRGPWVGALVIYFIYMMLGPRAIARTVKATMVAVVALAALLVSPLGSRITQVIPFLGGQVDSFNIVYREVLAERSLELIQQHPYLGDQNAYTKLQDLRQGVGVIDFVNTYADVAVFYGLIGLALFLGVILVGLYKDYRVLRGTRSTNPDLSMMGASLAACILGTLVMIYTSSFIFGYAKLFYVLAGLAAGYASAGYVYQMERTRASRSRVPGVRAAFRAAGSR